MADAQNSDAEDGAYLDVPGFKHDVFISYAHVDNQSARGEEERGWVDVFHRALKVELEQELGEKRVHVWQDHRELQQKGRLPSELEQAVSTSGVLVSVAYVIVTRP